MARHPPTIEGTRRTVPPPPEPARAATPEAAAKPSSLRIHRAGAQPVDLLLREDERYVLGRHDAADVVFESPRVSRLHGMLRHDGGRWFYEDHGSRNGSVLVRAGAGEQRPGQVAPHVPVELHAGDVLQLGDEEARVEALASARRGVDEDVSTGLSDAAREFNARLDLAARTRVPLFLLGPSGCGKTFSARLVHQRSGSPGAFVPINCARLPTDASALHSELLGHVRGAFTGAESARTGRLVLANGGTLFLDEVESLPTGAQGFLLDVLEATGEFSPLGARELATRPPVFRLVSASKVPLGQSRLRPDLCERLAEGHMWQVPTLDQRREDIPGMLRVFAAEQSSMLGVKVDLSDEAVAFAARAPWPGQVRQLRSTVTALAQVALAHAAHRGERPRKVLIRRTDMEGHLGERAAAFGLVQGPPMLAATPTLPPPPDGVTDVLTKTDARALTRSHILGALEECAGNRSEAARRLGIARNTLSRRLREFGIADNGEG